jgi:hypothetical protein
MSGGVKRTSNKHHCEQPQVKAGNQRNVKAITRDFGKWATLFTSLAKLVAALGNLTRIIMDAIR